MKNIVIILVVMFALLCNNNCTANSYKLDDSAVESRFNKASDISSSPFMDYTSIALFGKKEVLEGTEDKQMVAGIIAIAQIVTGIGWFIPLHRLYLGVGDGIGKILLGYICTGSGCGIILLVDAISLLMDSEGTKYIGNPKFLMWND